MSELGGRTLDWVDGAILMVDQTKLPTSVEMLRITAVSDLVDAIRRLSVRGAPAIGVAGAVRGGPGSQRERCGDTRGLRPMWSRFGRLVPRQ